MITVIIPTLNEEENIASVVRFAKKQPHVSEVLVVDDRSQDQTARIAREEGASVFTSSKLGKGISMKEGVQVARNEIISFLDGDIDPYPDGTIRKLTEPILKDEADFVKSAFTRNAGRVTELTAKPLLSIFFPDLMHFRQPLSGMIAGKRSLFRKLEFSDDYGVDVGILIDMHRMKARMKEVEIGYIENKSKPWQALGKMSLEVARTIIMKAASFLIPQFDFERPDALQEIRTQLELIPDPQLDPMTKMAVFDMDNTLLQGRFINACAEQFGFRKDLSDIRLSTDDPVILVKRIATLLKGRSPQELIRVADTIPLTESATDVIRMLKKRGYRTGIISDSYDLIADHIRNKLHMDFSLANELEFSKDSCTGEVKIPSFFFPGSGSICDHAVCKSHALQVILEKYGIKKENCISIGDSLNDLCMLRQSGLGVAYAPQDETMKRLADAVIESGGMGRLMTMAL